MWAPHWSEPLEIRWNDDLEDLTEVEVLDLAWVHDNVNGALNHLHVIGKYSLPPEPRQPNQVREEEEMVLLDENEEETDEQAQQKARERQEWERIREELQEAKVWEWESRRRPVIARHLPHLVEQKEMEDVVATIKEAKMVVNNLDREGNDNGVSGFDKDTWLTDHVINSMIKMVCEVRGYRHGKDPLKVWSRSVEGV